MCVWGGGGDRVVLPPRSDPWELDPVMLSVRCGTRGLTTCGVPVPPHVGAKPQVDKTARSSARKNASLFYAKVKTRIACWNVRTLGRLSEQSEKLLGLVQTMEEKKIELMALSETRWTGQGVERIKNKTFIYSGADKDRNYGVAIALSNVLGRKQAACSIQYQNVFSEYGSRPILVMHLSLLYMLQPIQPLQVMPLFQMHSTNSSKLLLQQCQ